MKLAKLCLLLAITLPFYGQTTNKAEALHYYQYNIEKPLNFKLASQDRKFSEFSFTSFDGKMIHGQISYPTKEASSYPVLIGLHAMGRSSQRWWKDSIKGGKTITHVNKLAEMANDLGYVVIALDARSHGKLKDPDMSLTQIMKALKTDENFIPYRDMILSTVKDHRVLLDWIQSQPQLDNSNIQLAGYSMGAQLSLILAAVDNRVNDVLAIVPPCIEEHELSMVSPVKLAPMIVNNRLMLISADADEYASTEENNQLFESITSNNKRRVVVPGGHILPETYLTHLEHWFVKHK